MGTNSSDENSSSYLIANYTRWWNYFWLHVSYGENERMGLDWRARTSLLMLRIVRSFSQVLKHVGRLLESTFNHFLANGGILKTVFRFSAHPQAFVSVAENSETYLSICGLLDLRTKLLLQTPSDLSSASPDSKLIADLCVMASKVAYESPAFIKSVVQQTWKMHLHGVYNCWNEFQKKASTQAFIFADREEDAEAVVLAFRGTEAFNGYDWCTDFDFSWYLLPQLGRVHLGFLEALGLGDRNHMETFQRLKSNIYENSRTPVSATPTSGLPDFVLSDQTKLLAYDHISEELMSILRRNRRAKLYITGHSLGGALATLFAAMLFYYKEENRLGFYREEDYVAMRIAAVYTFGQPRVGDANFASFMDNSLNQPTIKYFRVVYNSDLVARVPFDNALFGFKHCGRYFYYSYDCELQVLPQEPNPNLFSPTEFVLARVYGVCGLVQSLFMSYRYGEDFRETSLCTIARIAGVYLPGVADHSLVNYVNCIRLGPDNLVVEK